MDTPLSRLRDARKITAAEVARAVGCNKSHYGRVEKGEVTASPELANRIAKYFGNAITRDQILYPADYVPAPTQAPEEAKAS